MIRFIYNLFWPLGVLIFLPGYCAKMIRRGGYREKFGQRVGIYDGEVRNRLSNQRSTWLHAVSVGEVNIALKLANALRALEPDLHCVLTTTTTTGFALARKTAPPWTEVMYTPLDYWPIMRRAFSVIRPARIVLVEAEVWPNLAAAAHAHRIPLALVNARLSPRSERRYRRFRFFVAPTFRLLDLVCVPERRDIERWAALGVPRNRMHVTGSIKFDPDVQAQSHTVAASPKLDESGSDVFSPDSLVLFGGSTHRGEEEILVRVFLRLREQFPSLRLFIAPRINGWILVFGSDLPDPSDDVDQCFHFVTGLSRKLGHVQLFPDLIVRRMCERTQSAFEQQPGIDAGRLHAVSDFETNAATT